MYRPPPSKNNGLLDSTFPRELAEFLDYINTLRGKVIILGDLNVKYNNPSNWLTHQVIDLTTTYDFKQGVHDPTFSKSNNIIDWILYRENDHVFNKCEVNHTLTSDHVAITCTLNILKPVQHISFKTIRDMKNINKDNFRSDVKQMVQSHGSEINAEVLNVELENLINKHAPEERICLPPRIYKPWFPLVRDEFTQAKRAQRRAERRYRKAKISINKQLLDIETVNVTNIVKKGEKLYWNQKLGPEVTQKDLFIHSNNLLGRSRDDSAPNNIDTEDIANTFSEFFKDKVEQIRQSLDDDIIQRNVNPLIFDEQCLTSCLSDFETVDVQSIRTIIMQSNSKTCSLDPIPTSLLKDCVDEIAPALEVIINNSLRKACFPEIYKNAIVTPLLKKPSLDKNILKNYRPVSNLPFFGKMMEKIVLLQLKKYLDNHNLFPVCQSAYRNSHCTETALLNVISDILCDIDNNKISLLSLLDLSSAFDTIDHDILKQRLIFSYGIKGNALKWINSYLTGRTQRVITNHSSSQASHLNWGVPQGSVLGPILFILYTKPIERISLLNRISCQSFADDTQSKSSSKPDNFLDTVKDSQNCISNIKSWMNTNKLKLNDDKTEFLLIHSSFRPLPSSMPLSIDLHGNSISFSSNARNLGINISDTLSLEIHIGNLCRISYCALRNISSIRQFLDLSTTKTLMCTLILSKLDYCNSLFYGIPTKLLDKLQKVQNAAAKIVFKAKKIDHVTPLLKKLHWLPIVARIEYKIASICYKYFTQIEFPSYLAKHLKIYRPKRNLRSSNDERVLEVKDSNLKSYGGRSFASSAPRVWNSLPHNVRHSVSLSSFKKNLKTYLFCKSYPE